MRVFDDAHTALRRIQAAPADALTLMVVIATGIAISAVLFAVLNGVLAGSPYMDTRSLVVVESGSAERGVRNGGLTPVEAITLAEPDAPFETFGYWSWGGMTVYNEERPREFYIAQVSEGFFRSFAAAPALGRWFNADDYAAQSDAVMLSYREWQRLYGGSAEVIGSRLDTNQGSKQVIGVMPKFFDYPADTVGAWLPLPVSAFPLDQPWTAEARFLNAVARLNPDIDAAGLAARLEAQQTALAAQYRLPAPVWSIEPRLLVDIEVGALRGVLWASFGIGLLVMLIACGTAAILVDAKQSARTVQHALQLALGSSRRRLLRELVLELLLVSAAAALVGSVLALASIELLRELARDTLPRVDAIRVDAPVWLFVIGMALLVPLVAGLSGALRVRAEAGLALRGGRGVLARGRRRWLPALGVALSTASVVAGSALVVSLWQLQRVDPGLKPDGVYALQLFRSEPPETLRAFAAQLSERLAALPGVESVALANAAPLSIVGNFDANLKLPERDAAEPYLARVRRVSPDYLALMQQALLSGRGLTDTDRAGAEPVAVINDALARRVFGTEPALNRMIELPVAEQENVAHRVVGVVADTRNRGLREDAMPEVLLPFDAAPSQSLTILLRAPNGLSAPDRLLRDALYEIDPQESATRIFALADEFAAGLSSTRFFARTMAVVSIGALTLAAFGVFAVASLRHRQRMPELGLRLAVGAAPMQLLRDSLRDSAVSAVVGVAIGSLLALLALRALSAQLFGLESIWGPVLLFGALVLLTASFLAALPPALRALRIDPLSALRGP
jgi:putative ABC transport system permease protein